MSLKNIGNLLNAVQFVPEGFTIAENGLVRVTAALKGMTVEEILAASAGLSLSAQQMATALHATGLSAAETAVELALKGYNKEAVIAALNTARFGSEEVKAAVESDIFTAALQKGQTSSSGLSAALEGLWAKLAAHPFILIASAAAIAITAIVKYRKHQAELRQEMIDQGTEAKTTAEKIQDLYKKYQEASEAWKNGTGSKEDLDNATQDLISSLNVEGTELNNLVQQYGSLEAAIDHLKGGYKSLNEVIGQQTINSLQTELVTITQGISAAGDSLVSAMKGNMLAFDDVMTNNGIRVRYTDRVLFAL